MTNSIIGQKSFNFSVKIVNLFKQIKNEKGEFILSKQILRSGTYIGANVSEALYGQSNRDFIAKLCIARKEANEAVFWLRLLEETDYISIQESNVLKEECQELIKIMTSIILTVRTKYNIKD